MAMEARGVVAVIVTFIFAVCATWFVRRLALRYRVLDIPLSNRKVHMQPVPLLGGLAVIVAVVSGVIVAWPALTGGYLLSKHLVGVLVAAGILGVGGVLDDRRNLSPQVQVLFPLLACLVVIASGIGVDYITNPLGGTVRLDQTHVVLFYWNGLPYGITVIADLFTVAWLMGMMYTTKFLDGLDGLVSGISVIGMLIIFGLSMTTAVNQPETATLSLIAAAAFFGFLFWNWHPAKIFLGESGSLLAGFLLGTLAIISGAKIATALLIMGIPILDIAWVVLRRLFIEKRSPFLADRKHLHLRLLDLGLSHRTVVIVLYTFTAVFGVTALFLESRTKVFALCVLGVVMLGMSVWVVRRHQQTRV